MTVTFCLQRNIEIAPDKPYFVTGTGCHVRNIVAFLIFEQNATCK